VCCGVLQFEISEYRRELCLALTALRRVLQHVAVCVAVCCGVLQLEPSEYSQKLCLALNVLQRVLQRAAGVLRCVAVCCS